MSVEAFFPVLLAGREHVWAFMRVRSLHVVNIKKTSFPKDTSIRNIDTCGGGGVKPLRRNLQAFGHLL